MIKIVERIDQIIQEQQLTSAGFADAIGVQRSSISHVLSGRNKPSLDFILKVLEAFPYISPDWLLFGDNKPSPPTSTSDNKLIKKDDSREDVSYSNIKSSSDSEIDKIVFFFKDGRFETYHQKG
jgi:transcriptional regulator with XRE-family HTH domain